MRFIEPCSPLPHCKRQAELQEQAGSQSKWSFFSTLLFDVYLLIVMQIARALMRSASPLLSLAMELILALELERWESSLRMSFRSILRPVERKGLGQSRLRT